MLFENADDGIEMMYAFHNNVLKKELTSSTFFPRCFAGKAGGHLGLKNLFKNTKYEVPKNEKLCHFTTIQGLINIFFPAESPNGDSAICFVQLLTIA